MWPDGADGVGIALVLLGYLLGSVSFGLLWAKRAGVDLRSEGSGNVGATNVSRVLGRSAGRWVMVLDAAKGFAPTLAAHLTLGADNPYTAMTGVAAVLGHLLPVWHGFQGGKGAATALGSLLAVAPIGALSGGLCFFLLKKITRRASAGSVVGSLVAALVVVASHGGSGPVSAMAVALLSLVWFRHVGNIRRLLRGKEPPS